MKHDMSHEPILKIRFANCFKYLLLHLTVTCIWGDINLENR